MAVLPVASDSRPAVFFTAHSHQILSNCVHLLGVSVLAFCLAHRLPSLGSWKSWSNLTWGRLCVLLVLFDSWLFIMFTGVLVNGVGLSSSHVTCALAIYSCISFYAFSKVLIYGFLAEKVYIVWSGGNRTPRLKSTAYRICAVVLLGYVVILGLMIKGQNSKLRPDGLCIIGLKDYATIPLIVYDLSLNVFLTSMFLWPLWRSTVMSPRLKAVAKRTLYGALASLTISACNVAILTSLKGEEYGWACLGSCVTDVALNSIVLSWVTAGSYSQRSDIAHDRYSLPTMDVGPLTLVQTEGDLGKETNNRRSTLLATLHEGPQVIPESFYDYLPHEQLSLPEPASPKPIRKHWFWGSTPNVRQEQETRQSTSSMIGTTSREFRVSSPGHQRQLQAIRHSVIKEEAREVQRPPIKIHISRQITHTTSEEEES